MRVDRTRWLGPMGRSGKEPRMVEALEQKKKKKIHLPSEQTTPAPYFGAMLK